MGRVPRVAGGRIGQGQVRADHREFVGGDLADQNGTLGAEAGHGGGVSCGDPVRKDARAGGGRLVGDVDQVLDRDGKPAEGLRVTRCQHRIGAVGLILSPWLWLVIGVGYAGFLLWVGTPILMRTAADKTPVFVGAAVGIWVVLYIILNMIAQRVIFSGMMYGMM